MPQEQATRESWKGIPLPEERERLDISHAFTGEEYERVRMGFIPAEMEDKWFIYLEDGWLSCHRSWTGYCIFRIRLEATNGGYAIAEAWVNRDSAQYRSLADSPYDAALAIFLIDGILLHKEVPIPRPRHTGKG